MMKFSKIIIITIIILMFIITTQVYAVDPEKYRPGNPTDYDEFYNRVGIILGVVRNVGAVVSVLGIAVLGIRYMLASVQEKANYKETMVPFIIGIVILLSVTAIVTLVQDVAEETTSTTETTEE